jgi:hypothetical protein
MMSRLACYTALIMSISLSTTLIFADLPLDDELDKVTQPAAKRAIAKYRDEFEEAQKAYEKRLAEAKAALSNELEEARKEAVSLDQLDEAVLIRDIKKAIDSDETRGIAKTNRKAKIPKDAVKFGNHHYAVISDLATWHVARRKCEEMGGHLVTIETSKEETFVRQLIDKTTKFSVWLGASDEEVEGTWLWITGKPVTQVRIPDRLLDKDEKIGEHHLAYNGTSHDYNDWYAGGRAMFVCEWDK